MQFHTKLQGLRKSAGMTQLELAEKLMVSRQAISKWETGSAVPDMENMICICDLFGISLDYLVRDRQNQNEKSAYNHVMDRGKSQEDKKKIFIKSFAFLLIIAFILIIGWRTNLFAVTVIVTMWLIVGGVLFWGGKKIIALLSKFVGKGEILYQKPADTDKVK